MAESNRLEESLLLLQECISIAAELPSLYNNLAQTYRLLHMNCEALSAVELAIHYCKQRHETETLAMRQAHAQLGWLLYRTGDSEAAMVAFNLAARLGCLESRAMANRCNPYAQLCSQMMTEAINKLKWAGTK